MSVMVIFASVSRPPVGSVTSPEMDPVKAWPKTQAVSSNPIERRVSVRGMSISRNVILGTPKCCR